MGAFLIETKEYISKIDDGLQNSVGKYMCKETCPCVEIDVTKWDTSLQVELSDGKGEYRIN